MENSLSISPIPEIPSRRRATTTHSDLDGTYYEMPPMNSPINKEGNTPAVDEESDKTVSDLSNVGENTPSGPVPDSINTTAVPEPIPFPELQPFAEKAVSPTISSQMGLANSSSFAIMNSSRGQQQQDISHHEEDPYDMLLSPSRLNESDSDFLSRMAEPKPNHYYNQAPLHTCDHGFETQEHLEGQQYAVSDYSTLLAMINRAKAQQKLEAKLKERRREEEEAKAKIRVTDNNEAAYKRTSEWKERREESLKNMRERKRQLELEEIERVQSGSQLRDHRVQRNLARHLPPSKKATFSPARYTAKQATWQQEILRKNQLEKESQTWKETVEDRLGPLHPKDDWMVVALKNMSPADYELTESVQWVHSYAPPRKFLTEAAAEEYVLKEQRNSEEEVMEKPSLMPSY